MTTNEQAELALAGEPEPPTWEQICTNQLRMIEDLSRRNNELEWVIKRICEARIYWHCGARVAEH